MKKSNTIFIILFQLLVLNIQAQEKTVKDVLDKASHLYLSKKEYLVDMTFTMYRGVSGNNITETYKGTMAKKGAYTKNEVLDTKIYIFPEANITIDEKQKILNYTPLKTNPQQKTPIDLSVFLEYFKQNKLQDSGKEWICEMVSEANMFSQIPYGKVLIHINKSDYRITKQVLYFSRLIPFQKENSSDIEQDYGRLVIDLKHNWNPSIEEKKIEDFLVVKPNHKVQLHTAYATYQLVDQTEYNN